jgi:FkbM family methyltransferase
MDLIYGKATVEPQKDVYENGLCKTYAGNGRVILENVALGKTQGELIFYRINFTRATWATGLSSFDRANIENHWKNGYIQAKAREEGVELPQDVEEIIEAVSVPTTTPDQLLNKHNVRKVDVVCIDTEGYDFEILKMIDFDRLSSEVILFESKNLPDTQFIAAKALLSSSGYRLFWEKGDTLAIKYPYPLLRRAIGALAAFYRKI